MFLVPLVAYTSIGLARQTNLSLSFVQLAIILLAGSLFSYMGNRFSLKGIKYAPNVGYSLLLSKSYVVFTTIVAVLFLGSSLTSKNAFAILVIVSFSALIMLSNKAKSKKGNFLWLPYSLGAFLCWGMLSLVSKYLLNQGIGLYTWLIYLYFIVSGLILCEMKQKKVDFRLIQKDYKLFLGIGIFSTLFNLFMFNAIGTAPNVGYVNAINASSISLVTISSAIFFKDELTLRKIAGVLGATVGLILLLI